MQRSGKVEEGSCSEAATDNGGLLDHGLQGSYALKHHLHIGKAQMSLSDYVC